MKPLLPFCAWLVPSLLCGQAPEAPGPADYRVHEWGTFTSMVSAAGHTLEGLHREEEALPKFVHDLARIREWARHDGFKLPASRVTQKMETPVIYFHSERPLRVEVSVYYRNGLMTQFFPLPDSITPSLGEIPKKGLDLSKVDWSSLHWDIDVLPRSAGAPKEIPNVTAGDPWALARQVDSSFVRTRDGGTPRKTEAEHYLFYRGLGTWTPPLHLQAKGDDTVELHNAMPGAVPFVALLQVDENGGRFVLGTPLAADAKAMLDLSGATRIEGREQLARRLGAAVLQALVAEGLHLDEARAMVATWSRSWFQSRGARAIYVLPRQQVDAVLPLQIQPPPRELVRVLVGRLEYITPSAQQAVERALLERTAADATVRDRAAASLTALDRFLEPHLRNVADHGVDPAARAAAAGMLARLPQ